MKELMLGNAAVARGAYEAGVTVVSSYPGTPLRVGSSGPNGVVLQTALNRISQSYPAIPKIASIDGIFGSRTEASVQAFQRIFGLSPDGVVGPATWYAIVRLYTAVTSLSELRSQGQRFYAINWSPPNSLSEGSSGEKVQLLQYMLSVLSEYIPNIPPLVIDSVYGPATRNAVLAAQRRFGLPETGSVDARTWDEIYDQYSGIETTTLRSGELFPGKSQQAVATASPRVIAATYFSQQGTRGRNGTVSSSPQGGNSSQQYRRTTNITQFPGRDLSIGMQDPVRQEVVR